MNTSDKALYLGGLLASVALLVACLTNTVHAFATGDLQQSVIGPTTSVASAWCAWWFVATLRRNSGENEEA